MTAAKKKRARRRPVDKETAALRRVDRMLSKMSQKELFALAVRAGIYTKSGKLTKHYRDDAAPSASRPTD
jgi:hypothetical protein